MLRFYPIKSDRLLGVLPRLVALGDLARGFWTQRPSHLGLGRPVRTLQLPRTFA